MTYDVLIIGGGPAGLSAALVLGRACRKVLLCDAGEPRNSYAHRMHGFLSRDPFPPDEMLRISREQVRAYPNVEMRDVRVVALQGEDGCFTLTDASGRKETGRKLLLATGLKDTIPEVPGLREIYGHSVHHCPYCDGWEIRDQPVAAYGKGKRVRGLARTLLGWTRDVVIVTDGPGELIEKAYEEFEALGVPIIENPIKRLEHDGRRLQSIHFKDRPPIKRAALFFSAGQSQRCDLARSFVGELGPKGALETTEYKETWKPGVYCAGDASEEMHMVIVAAGNGATAAVAINNDLIEKDVEAVIKAKVMANIEV